MRIIFNTAMLGDYFQKFLLSTIGTGQYKSASEVIHAALSCLLVEETGDMPPALPSASSSSGVEIEIHPSFHKFIYSQLTSGRYSSEIDLISAGLRSLERVHDRPRLIASSPPAAMPASQAVIEPPRVSVFWQTSSDLTLPAPSPVAQEIKTLDGCEDVLEKVMELDEMPQDDSLTDKKLKKFY